MALDLQEGSVSSETSGSTRGVKQYWKTILAGLAAAASIAACVYFPPAALFLSPAVELLVGAMSFAGMWAGLVAFAAVVAGVATLSFAATRLLLEGVDALANKFSGEAVNNENEESHNENEKSQAEKQVVSEQDKSQPSEAGEPPHHTSPISRHSSQDQQDISLSDDEQSAPGFAAG